MPVAEPDLELPRIDELDTSFKRRLALSVALIALLGSLLGLGAAWSGGQEDRLARDSQRAAVAALAERTAAYADIYDHLGRYAEAVSLRQQYELAAFRAQLVPGGEDAAARDRWRHAHRQLSDLTPLLTAGESPNDRERYHSERLTESLAATLKQEAGLETAEAWGGKSERYVLGITLLAIALTLLGLSLTVATEVRHSLIRPAAVIAGLVLVGSLVVTLDDPPSTRDEAIGAVVEGDQLMMTRDYQGAVAAYTRAIDMRDDYATAYRQRSLAHTLAGAPGGLPSTYIVTTTSREARQRSIDDLNRALDGRRDYLSLVNQGANYFHVRDYATSERLTREALKRVALPLPQANLALVLAAQGREKEAVDAYRKLVELIRLRPDDVEKAELFASSRWALAKLARLQPSRGDLAQRLQGQLVAAEAAERSPSPEPPPTNDPVLTNLRVEPAGAQLNVTFEHRGIPPASRVSWIGYFRPEGVEDWLQRPDLDVFDRFGHSEPGTGQLSIVDSACPPAGTYRIDVFLEERLLASAQAERPKPARELVSHYDGVGAITTCRPTDWRIDREQAGTVEMRSGSGPTQRLEVRAVPLPAALLERPPTDVVTTALDTLGGQLGQGRLTARDFPAGIGGVPGTARRYELGGGQHGVVWAAVGTDSTLRLLTAVYSPDDQTLVSDLIARVRFGTRFA